MNIQKLMRQAREMQDRMQRELETVEVEASVGGGMVTVRMNGHKHLLEIQIDPEVLDPQDPAMIQDLVLSAINEAARQVEEEISRRVGALGPGFPGLG